MEGMPGELRQGLSIRKATDKDCPAIAEIYNQSVDSGYSTFEQQHKDSAHFESMLNGFAANEAMLVLTDETGADSGLPAGTMLGFGKVVRYSDREGYRHAAETATYVRRDLLRRGYGSMLKRALIERCSELGFHHIVARVVASNAASIEYNLRFGYEIVGTQREVGIVNGQWCNVTIMQLVLPGEMPAK